MPDQTQERISPVVEVIASALREADPMDGPFEKAMDIWTTLVDAGYAVTRRVLEPTCECGHPPRHHDKQTGRCYGRGCKCERYTKAP